MRLNLKTVLVAATCATIVALGVRAHAQLPTDARMGAGAYSCSDWPADPNGSEANRLGTMAILSWVHGYVVASIDMAGADAAPYYEIPDQRAVLTKLLEVCASKPGLSMRGVAATVAAQITAEARQRRRP